MTSVVPVHQPQRFGTASPSAAHHHLASALAPHDLRAAGSLRFRHASGRIGELAIHRLSYGASVQVRRRDDSRLALFQITREAPCRIGFGDRDLEASAGTLLFIPPWRAYEKEFTDRCEQVVIAVEAGIVQQALADDLGAALPAEALAPTVVPLGAHPVLRALLVAAARSVMAPAPQPALGLDRTLLLHLLHLVAQDRADPVERSAATKRATAFVRDCLGEPIGVADMAAAAGTSLRALEIAFARELRTTPRDHLRLQRLHAARRLLLAPLGPRSVTEAALATGHTHLGRFSIAYRDYFSETPSATLRRRR